MILSAGLFGGLAAAFGPVSAVAGSAAGIASGMSTVGLGIVNLIGSDDNSRLVPPPAPPLRITAALTTDN